MSKVEELHDIDSPFPALNSGNVGLLPLESVSQSGLRHVRILPRLRQQLAQLRVFAGEERLRHPSSSESAGVYSKTDYSKGLAVKAQKARVGCFRF